MADIYNLLQEGNPTELGQLLNNQPRYIPAVADYLASGSPQIRQTAAWSLHHTADPDPPIIRFDEISSQLLDALHDDNPEVRSGAAATTGTLAKPDRLPQFGTDATDQLVDQMTDAGIDDEFYWTSYALMRVADYAPREVTPHRAEIKTVLQEVDQELDDEDYIDPDGEKPPHVLHHLKQILESNAFCSGVERSLGLGTELAPGVREVLLCRYRAQAQMFQECWTIREAICDLAARSQIDW